MPAACPIADLYVGHQAWLKNWLHRKVGCPEQAADLMHDVFIKVMLNSAEAGIREPRAYLATIAGNLAIDFFRRQRIERGYQQALASLPEHAHPSAEEAIVHKETLMELDRMLDGLGSRVKQAFLLAQCDTMSYRDIAARLNVSVRSVNTYVARAMAHCCLLLA